MGIVRSVDLLVESYVLGEALNYLKGYFITVEAHEQIDRGDLKWWKEYEDLFRMLFSGQAGMYIGLAAPGTRFAGKPVRFEAIITGRRQWGFNTFKEAYLGTKKNTAIDRIKVQSPRTYERLVSRFGSDGWG